MKARPKVPEFGESYLNLTCGCGHEADLMEFRTTPINGELPKNCYQCPACGCAWEIVTGPPRIGWSGMPLPGKTEAIPRAPVL